MISALFITSFLIAFCVSIVVQRMKKSIDFSFTVYFLHFLVVSFVEGTIFHNAVCWIVFAFAFICTAALSEYLCLRREMADISIDEIMGHRSRQTNRVTSDPGTNERETDQLLTDENQGRAGGGESVVISISTDTEPGPEPVPPQLQSPSALLSKVGTFARRALLTKSKEYMVVPTSDTIATKATGINTQATTNIRSHNHTRSGNLPADLPSELPRISASHGNKSAGYPSSSPIATARDTPVYGFSSPKRNRVNPAAYEYQEESVSGMPQMASIRLDSPVLPIQNEAQAVSLDALSLQSSVRIEPNLGASDAANAITSIGIASTSSAAVPAVEASGGSTINLLTSAPATSVASINTVTMAANAVLANTTASVNSIGSIAFNKVLGNAEVSTASSSLGVSASSINASAAIRATTSPSNTTSTAVPSSNLTTSTTSATLPTSSTLEIHTPEQKEYLSGNAGELTFSSHVPMHSALKMIETLQQPSISSSHSSLDGFLEKSAVRVLFRDDESGHPPSDVTHSTVSAEVSPTTTSSNPSVERQEDSFRANTSAMRRDSKVDKWERPGEVIFPRSPANVKISTTPAYWSVVGSRGQPIQNESSTVSALLENHETPQVVSSLPYSPQQSTHWSVRSSLSRELSDNSHYSEHTQNSRAGENEYLQHDNKGASLVSASPHLLAPFHDLTYHVQPSAYSEVPRDEIGSVTSDTALRTGKSTGLVRAKNIKDA